MVVKKVSDRVRIGNVSKKQKKRLRVPCRFLGMIRKLKFRLCVLICRWFCEIGSRDGVIWNDARRNSDWMRVRRIFCRNVEARRAFPIGGMCGFDFHGIRYYSDIVGINTTLAVPVRNFRLSVVRGWRAGIGTVVGKYSKNNSFCRICRYFPDGFHAGSREGYGLRQEGRRAFGTENIRTRHLFINGRARMRLARDVFLCSCRGPGRLVVAVRKISAGKHRFPAEMVSVRLFIYPANGRVSGSFRGFSVRPL